MHKMSIVFALKAVATAVKTEDAKNVCMFLLGGKFMPGMEKLEESLFVSGRIDFVRVRKSIENGDK